MRSRLARRLESMTEDVRVTSALWSSWTCEMMIMNEGREYDDDEDELVSHPSSRRCSKARDIGLAQLSSRVCPWVYYLFSSNTAEMK